MNYKRLELYVWWKCNQKCTYCMEYPTMEKSWFTRVSKYDILKTLINYKLKWYNHVTYLWWEPLIQPVFFDALKIWKKLWYTILVTTNCTTLHLEKQADKFLPYIDELFLSVEAIFPKDQQKISRTKNYVQWDLVFYNISKYRKWKLLKANIVITNDNIEILFDIVKYLDSKSVKEIAITYPDIDIEYYWIKHISERVAPSYKRSVDKIIDIVDYCIENCINLKLPDFPFCVFPKDNLLKYIKLTDDYDYQTRLKISNDNKEVDRKDLSSNDLTPRDRINWEKCNWCKYIKNCRWYSFSYEDLFWLTEINPIK